MYSLIGASALHRRASDLTLEHDHDLVDRLLVEAHVVERREDFLGVGLERLTDRALARLGLARLELRREVRALAPRAA